MQRTDTNIPYLISNIESQKNKDIRYINKDFESFRTALINFAKTYFPDSYKDFTPESTGMMLIELASYIGDVLSFYLDQQFKELFLDTAIEKKNILKLAKAFGYKPKGKTPSEVDLDVYLIVPSELSGTVYVPDYDYGLKLHKSALVTTNTTPIIYFQTDADVDFSQNTIRDKSEYVVYQYNATTGLPTHHLLKKVVKARSGKIETMYYNVDSPSRFLDVKVDDTDVIEIVDVFDSDGNEWYKVDYLTQETIFEATSNTQTNDPILYTDADEVPYLLKMLNVSRRFIEERDSDGYMHLRFGSGVSYNPDNEIIPNPWSIQVPISGSTTFTSPALDPTNFLNTRTLGMAPYNTTLTIRYRAGGGVATNSRSNTISTFINRAYTLDTTGLNSSEVSNTVTSLAINNPEAAYGGRDEESLEEIRMNASAHFASQNRVVTREDYIVRAYSLPPKFGSVAKVFAIPAIHASPNTPTEQFNYAPVVSKELQDELITSFVNSGMNLVAATQIVNQLGRQKYETNPNTRGESLYHNIGSNPLGINLYVLAYNDAKQLTIAASALKYNLKNYINKHRMITDGVNILDGYIINIGIHFKVVASKQYNKHEVLEKCITEMRDYFKIENWQFNQPIIFSDIYSRLQNILGVSSVSDIRIVNLYGGNYSSYVYDITSNTYDSVIYPSREVSIFEIKYPSTDIKGIVK